jgi:hypothetical protein
LKDRKNKFIISLIKVRLNGSNVDDYNGDWWKSDQEDELMRLITSTPIIDAI